MKSSKDITLAIDLMGGDRAPFATIEGLKNAIEKHQQVKFKIFGNSSTIKKKHPDFNFYRYDFVECPVIIGSSDIPSKALRNSRGSSMRMAIESVAKGNADAVISAGNTGALMAISKLVLKTLPSIDRPAICTFIPTKDRPCLMLDVGANINCEPNNLLEFAIMGDAFLKATIGNANGKIGMLNIGTEDIKGHAILREANELLKNSPRFKDRYIGYIEPDKVFDGMVDIVVTDGFNGNIFIKTAEGIGRWMKDIFIESFNSTIISKIGYLFARSALKKNLKVIDPKNYNGAMFVGLNGIVIKSHGGTDELGFAKAIDSAVVLVQEQINTKISELIKSCS